MITMLLMSLATAAANSSAKPVRDPARIRCVREIETGSLSKVNKICHSEAEWQELRTRARDTTTQMQSSTGVGQNPN